MNVLLHTVSTVISNLWQEHHMGMLATRVEFGRSCASEKIGPFLFLASPISKIFLCWHNNKKKSVSIQAFNIGFQC